MPTFLSSLHCRMPLRVYVRACDLVHIVNTAPCCSLLDVDFDYNAISMASRDENGSNTDGYHQYYICFHISVWVRIRIRIVSTMSDRIRLDIDIINMRFEYSDTDIVSDVGYPDSDTNRSQPL